MRTAHADHAQYVAADFVPVDYVWRGGPLVDVVGDARFDYAIASHVIEHVPDMIGWVRHVLDVLVADGQLVLAIPDKRYTFDAARPDTSVGRHLEIAFRSPQVPQVSQVFEHFAGAVAMGEAELRGLWDGTLEPSRIRRLHTDEEALRHSLGGPRAGVYTDCHASVFTPRSFLHALSDLVRLGQLDVEVVGFFDTACYANEFMVMLRKRAYAGEAERLGESRRILDAYLPGLDGARALSPVRQATARRMAAATGGREGAANESFTPREADLLRRLEEVRRERDDARERMNAVLGSATWRVMEPYRRLMRRFGRA